MHAAQLTTILYVSGYLAFAQGSLEPPVRYVCHRAAGEIKIDGVLDDAGWRETAFSTPFVDIVDGTPAWLESRVALVWDAENLYFGFKLEEPDVRAELTERDALIWTENDVELFIAGENAYYELEINALNTVYEVFWIWNDARAPDSIFWNMPEFDPSAERILRLSGVGGHQHPRGERLGFLDWDLPGLRQAVLIDGTLNNSEDRDRGWSVEVAIPWKGLQWLAEGRSLPPKNGDTWRIDCSRFQRYDLSGDELERSVGWTWNRHGHYDSHIPERFTYVEFRE